MKLCIARSGPWWSVALTALLIAAGRAAAFPGVQTDVPVAALSGWTLCHSVSYADISAPLTEILNSCDKPHLMLACRATGSPTLSVAAHAPRADVTFVTADTAHEANGVSWYFNDERKWGFAPQGEAIDLAGCDRLASNLAPGQHPDKRVCWQAAGGRLIPGWRCGAATGLQFPAQFDRLIFEADSVPCGDGVLDFREECDDGNLAAGDGCDGNCAVETCYSCSGQPSTCAVGADGLACDDGVFCNGADSCAAGACTVHAGTPCGDGECDDVCNEGPDTCVRAPGTPCTPDANQCTDDICNDFGACAHIDNIEPCDDGLFCNGIEQCSNGSCRHFSAPCFEPCRDVCDEAADECDPTAAGVDCPDDNNVCTADACDGAGSCVHPSEPLGSPCPADASVCTEDYCDGAGTCAHPPLAAGTSCPEDGNACTADECDGSGACGHPSRPDGSECDDDSVCTRSDSCDDGQCVGSDPVVCEAPLCAAPAACDPSTGLCAMCPEGYTPGGGGCQKSYPITLGMLFNLQGFCDDIHRYNNCLFDPGCGSRPFGFRWTDAGTDAVGEVTRVDVSLETGLDCTGGLPHPVDLNDVPLGAYTTTAEAACNCALPPPIVSRRFSAAPPSVYEKGGLNFVSIATSQFAGLSRAANGHYGAVTVTYAFAGPAYSLRDDCRQAQRGKLKYRNELTDGRDSVRWLWSRGESSIQSEFADPAVAADYQLCVFGETSGAPLLVLGAEVAANASRWQPLRDVGYRYADGAMSEDGIRQILLKGDVSGRSKIVVRGKGAELDDRDQSLAGATGIRVQLTNTHNGKCWESRFPLGDVEGGIHTRVP